MSSMTFGQKNFTPTPPEKGSFPLDHDNICRKFMVAYMVCLKDSDHRNEKCRHAAKEYFQCRMEKGLMAKEDWDKLGYGDTNSSTATDAEKD